MTQMNLEELIEMLLDAGSVELEDVQMDIGDLVLDIGGQTAAPGQVQAIQQMMLGIRQTIQAPLAQMSALEQILLGQKRL